MIAPELLVLICQCESHEQINAAKAWLMRTYGGPVSFDARYCSIERKASITASHLDSSRACYRWRPDDRLVDRWYDFREHLNCEQKNKRVLAVANKGLMIEALKDIEPDGDRFAIRACTALIYTREGRHTGELFQNTIWRRVIYIPTSEESPSSGEWIRL